MVCRADPPDNVVDADSTEDRHTGESRPGAPGTTCARKFYELARFGSSVRLGDGIKCIRFVDG